MKIITSEIHAAGLNDEALAGLLTSYFNVCMTVNRSNNLGALKHFYGERLRKKSERSALNNALNALVNALARKKKRQPKALLESIGQVSADDLGSLMEGIEKLLLSVEFDSVDEFMSFKKTLNTSMRKALKACEDRHEPKFASQQK